MLIDPSWLLEFDEEMSAYLGEEGVLPGEGADPKGIPFRSFIERKPEPLGAEYKTMVDGTTGVGLRAEVQEGAARHAMQPW